MASALTPDVLATIALSLYRRNLSALAFIITEKLLEGGVESWVLRTLSAHLALRLDQDEIAAHSLARLTQLLAAASAADRESARALLDPLLPNDTIRALESGNLALAHAQIKLWAAIDPDTLRRFTLPPADRPPDVARFRVQGDDSRLYPYELPPTGAPRTARKVVLGIRHLWNPRSSTSREHDIPIRMASAIEDYGWHALRHDLRDFHDAAIVADDYQALAALCRDHQADVLILDDYQPKRGKNAAGEIIRALRHDCPHLRVIGTYFDPWLPEEWNDIEAGADCLDAVWSFVVTGVWHRPAFAGKMLCMPYPHGGHYPPAPPVQPGFRFGGGVQYSNWDRAFWLTALTTSGLAVKKELSSHNIDNLDALASFRAYMVRQGQATTAALNFARRSNDTHTITGRTFETLATGNLLVQERSDDVDQFFVAGRHYLRFETITDLCDIAHLIRTEPDFVEGIRQEGAAFFRQRYADERMMGYLDHFLFHRATARRAAA